MGCADNEVPSTVTTEVSTPLFEYSGVHPTNVLMISIDTWRKDQVDTTLSSSDKTSSAPFISNMVSEGVHLSNHHSSSSWTYPSMTAALAGQDLVTMNFVPSIGDKTGIMPATVTFLPTLLSNEGYNTGIVTANGFLCSEYEIGDKYDYEECLPPKDTAFDALALRSRGLALAETLSAGKTPWLLHLHLIDPHLPYDPPAAYLDEVNALPPLSYDFSSSSAQALQVAWDDLAKEDQGLFLTHTTARYRALTRYVDDEINGLMSDLSEQGLLEDTLVVLFADHGEQLFEHGSAGHTTSLHSQETTVTAAFWAKNLLPNIWTGLTSHHDLVPTILDQLQLEVPQHITGITAGERTDDTVIFSYLLTPIQFYISTIIEDHKLIYGWHDGSKLLYNIASDPEEQNDIYDNTLDSTAKLWLALDEELARLQPLISLEGPEDAVP